MAAVSSLPPPARRRRRGAGPPPAVAPLLFRLMALTAATLLAIFSAGTPAVAAAAPTDAQLLAAFKPHYNTPKLMALDVELLVRVLSISPRPFSLVITLLADGCAACDEAAKLLHESAKAFASGPPSARPSTPVVFGAVTVSSSDKSFLATTGITHVPKVYHLSPSVKWPVVMAGGPNDLPAKSELTQAGVRGWLNSVLGSRLAVRRSNYAVPFVPVIKALSPLLGAAGIAGAAAVGWTGAWRSPWLYFAMLMGVYTFSLAGGHYAWIHNVPWAVVDANGVTRYVADGNRAQYGAEGVATATGCVLMGGLWVVVHELPSWLGQGAGSLSRAASWAAALAIWFGWTALVGLYAGKMPGYLTYTSQ